MLPSHSKLQGFSPAGVLGFTVSVTGRWKVTRNKREAVFAGVEGAGEGEGAAESAAETRLGPASRRGEHLP